MSNNLKQAISPLDLVIKLTSVRKVLRFGTILIAIPSMLIGCATEAEFLAQNKPSALNTALTRGRFELNCPSADAQVLSQKVTYINGLGVGMAGGGGYEWTEYTVGVRGCDKQTVYMVACRDQDNCNAFAQTSRLINDVQQ